MEVMKGQFWKGTKFGGIVHCVRFVTRVEGRLAHYWEYQDGREVPAVGSADSLHWSEHWQLIDAAEANALIHNMELQDTEFAARQASRTMESLAAAMKILERRDVAHVEARNGVINVSTERGAVYTISVGDTGFSSKQTALPDPDW